MLEYLLLADDIQWSRTVVFTNRDGVQVELATGGCQRVYRDLLYPASNEDQRWCGLSILDVEMIACCDNLVLFHTSSGLRRYEDENRRTYPCSFITL